MCGIQENKRLENKQEERREERRGEINEYAGHSIAVSTLSMKYICKDGNRDC